jgi:hypothetical protein
MIPVQVCQRAQQTRIKNGYDAKRPNHVVSFEYPVFVFINLKNSKDKNIRKICKKLDEIVRLLVKNFFFKSASFGWLKFKFHQICTNEHQILIFQNSQNIRNKYDKKLE